MALSRQLLQTAMNRLQSKLYTLLLPRVSYGGYCLGPLPSEIRTSADLMLWFADELPHARLSYDEEQAAQHRNWPNVHDWRNFVKAIEALSVEFDPPGEGRDPAQGGGMSGQADPTLTTQRDEAMKAFDEARERLLSQCRLMLKEAPGAAAPGKASRAVFLPNDSQRRVYRELVLQYYDEYILGRDLKHKDLMVHWAAVYQAIADRSGLRHEVPFCGPEFDEFIYDYCGIAYNSSDTRRGRYRTIQDLRANCLDNSRQCAQRQDFNLYRSNMSHIIASQHRVVSQRGTDVPSKLQ